MQPQSKETSIRSAETAILPAGRLLFALTLTSYAFWLVHSFAIRNSFRAVSQLLLKSQINP
jgi:hypothetical protein